MRTVLVILLVSFWGAAPSTADLARPLDVQDPGVIEAAKVSTEQLALPGHPIVELENEGRSEHDENGRQEQRAGVTGTAYIVETTQSLYESLNTNQLSQGRQTVDIEVRWNGTSERYTALWAPVNGTVHRLIQGTPTDWSNFISSMAPLAGRWLDVEVGYFGSDKRYSALFLEDGDDYGYALHTTNTDTGFQSFLDTYRRSGRSLIDFEAYRLPSGETRFVGVWVNDPKQPMTHLFYNLESPHVTDLVNPLMGRILDVERYYSDLHGEDRYAVLFAQYRGGGWGLFRNQTSTQLSANNAAIADSNTFMVDLDPVVTTGGAVRYNAVWGDSWKSMNEVDPMPAPLDQEALSPELQSVITTFEQTFNRGVVGLYAKNLRTNQSIAYRADEPFYLASASKTAVHIRYWMEVQAGNIQPTDTMQYSNSANTGDAWYVDERPFPGFASGAPGRANDLGQSFSIDRFDRAMMTVSDNGATSALVDDTTYGVAYDALDLNEWLASEPGIGRGWGITTSIQDVDRYLLYQSQQRTQSVGDQSYFQLPGFAIGPRWRGTWDVCTINSAPPTNCVGQSCTRCSQSSQCPSGESCVEIEDPWGALASFFSFGAGGQAPRVDSDIGYPRYYNMLLSSATPRAVGNLWEGLAENRWLDPTTTTSALFNAGEGTSLDDASSFPSGISTESKGGTKRNVCTDTGWFRYDGETIVYNVLMKDTTLPCSGTSSNRSIYMPQFGYEILRQMGTDLTVVNPASDAGAVPTTIRIGESLAFFANISNLGGGDADPVDVEFRLSDDPEFSFDDILLGSDETTPIAGYGNNLALSNAPVPTINRQNYYLTWRINPNNDTPEFRDDSSSQRGAWPTPITVQASLEPIEDLSFTNKLSVSWGEILDAANYRIYQGSSSSLPALADGSLDSCQTQLVVSPSTSAALPQTPPPGQFYWYLVQAENDGPLLPASAGARLLNSAGQCGDSCAQPKCTTGVALEPTCDLCVSQICDVDPYCCDTAWDSVCVERVRTTCGSLACSEAAGSCAHPVCESGTLLDASCDSPPLATSCVNSICAADPYCCDTAWDGACVGAVGPICDATCD